MKANKGRARIVVAGVLLAVLFLVGAMLTGPGGAEEPVQEAMRDAVVHEEGKLSFFGLTTVNPAVFSGMVVTGLLLAGAAAVRIFLIPRFRYQPGKAQMLLESMVGFFDDIAVSNSPHHNGFLRIYIFSAGLYIFTGTFFELFGVQWMTTQGRSLSLPAPLSDINGAIALGCLSYLVILSGGLVHNGIRGLGSALKEFSLPISMSFRLFGALLSGLLVSELVYHYLALSFFLPVVVGVLFTLLHALIQTYVLVLLTALFYGEVSEPRSKASA